MAVHSPALHDEIHVRGGRDVGYGITPHRDDIRRSPDLECAKIVALQELCRDAGRDFAPR